MNTASQPIRRTAAVADNIDKHYPTIWRWHLYAGLYVIPFMLMLSLTGLIMLLYQPVIEPILYPKLVNVASSSDAPLSWGVQQQRVEDAFPGGKVKQLTLPHAADESARFLVETAETKNLTVFVNPYTSEILGSQNKDTTLYALADDIHGSLLLGRFGDGLIELAAGLTLVLLITGACLWWRRGRRDTGDRWKMRRGMSGRSWWRELHAIIGIYVAIFLLFFVLSGLSWTGIWGAKLVQAWNSFPAGVFSDIPLSEQTHASLNPGVHEEVPWNLEQTPLPESGSLAGKPGIPPALGINLDTVIQFAKDNGMTYFRVNLPTTDKGVYSVMAATMSRDITDATQDRALHIDQYSGKVLADIGFQDYSLMAKAMAVGIPLHMGTWTKVNLALNVLLCLAIILLSISGALLWWKRRPSGGTFSLQPPRSRAPFRRLWMIWLAVGIFVPLVGAVLVITLLLERTLHLGMSRWKQSRQ